MGSGTLLDTVVCLSRQGPKVNARIETVIFNRWTGFVVVAAGTTFIFLRGKSHGIQRTMYSFVYHVVHFAVVELLDRWRLVGLQNIVWKARVIDVRTECAVHRYAG